MSSLTKKFPIAMFVLCSVQFGAYGSAINHDMVDKKLSRAVIPMNENLGEFQDCILVMKIIFEEASKNGADPRDLECVCKSWYNFMRYQIPTKGSPTADQAGISYTTKLNDIFMEDCMRRYREGIVSRAVLIYKKGQSDECKINFSDFIDGTADLSGCGDVQNDQVYTTSKDRFFEVGGANKDKVVTFIGPCHMVQDLLPSCDNKPNSIVMLWRLGSAPNLRFDYLSSETLEGLAGRNMFENWARTVGGAKWGVVHVFHVRL